MKKFEIQTDFDKPLSSMEVPTDVADKLKNSFCFGFGFFAPLPEKYAVLPSEFADVLEF